MTLAQLLKTSRPRFWIYLLGPILVAIAASNLSFTVGVILLILYATFPANLLIYGVNDIFDRDTDALNAKKSGYESRLDAASQWYLVFWIIILNVPFLIAFALTLPASSFIWMGIFLLTGIGYSAPPIRAKTKPFLDASFNILYVCLGFAAYTHLTSQMVPWHIVLAAACWCAAMHAYSAVPDIKADKGAKLATIATILGGRTTIIVCSILYLLSCTLSFQSLGLYSVIAGVIYTIMMTVSLILLPSGKVFSIYRYFPLVNSLVGMGLWFWIVLVR